MKKAVPFQSPPSMEMEIQLPNAGVVQGMMMKKGITLIVGETLLFRCAGSLRPHGIHLAPSLGSLPMYATCHVSWAAAA